MNLNTVCTTERGFSTAFVVPVSMGREFRSWEQSCGPFRSAISLIKWGTFVLGNYRSGADSCMGRIVVVLVSELSVLLIKKLIVDYRR
jgi:hypothetical protein